MIYRSRRMRKMNAAHMGEGGIKAVMLRHYDAGLNYEEIAATLGLPESTVGYYMKRYLDERKSEENTHASPIAAA